MADPDDGATAGMPRWVKVFLISAAVLALLAAVWLLISGGDHGPGRHMRSSDTQDIAPVAIADVAPFGVGC